VKHQAEEKTLKVFKTFKVSVVRQIYKISILTQVAAYAPGGIDKSRPGGSDLPIRTEPIMLFF